MAGPQSRALAGRRLATLLLLLLGGAQVAAAQDSTRTWLLGADHESGIYAGMQLGSRFRLEPEFGAVRSRDQTQFDAGFGSTTETVTASNYRIGVGLLREWQTAPRVRLYAGPRIGAMFLRLDDSASGATSGTLRVKRTDLFVAGSIGAEFFPVDRVSFGGDVQLRYVGRGRESRSSAGSGAGGFFLPSDPTVATRGLLMLRFYL